VFQSLTW